MDQKGYLGLDFDFEYLGAENRDRYNRFVQKARARLKEKGYFISSALAPKLGPQNKKECCMKAMIILLMAE